MAFDGTVVAAAAAELNRELTGGRIAKIAQPESDELLLTVKTDSGQKLLFLSANASLPLIYLTDTGKPAPITAPTFCMVLRKHIGNGRILSVTQPGLERIIHIQVEHLDELGDYNVKTLVIELMGKHSNIIFVDHSDTIVDSIKRVPPQMSSVREVLPGRPYFIAKTSEKADPFGLSAQAFCDLLTASPNPAAQAIVAGITGFSPALAEELCCRAGVDSSQPASAYEEAALARLAAAFVRVMEDIRAGRFTPNIIYRNGRPLDFSVFESSVYAGDQAVGYGSVSEMLRKYYAERNAANNVRQRSADLRKLTDTAIERCRKKYDLQLKQERDTEKREKFRLYGELLQAFGYGHDGGEKQITVTNYYDNAELTIPLDPDLSALENAKKYFDRYQKLKRTHEALSTLLVETKDDLEHLLSIRDAIERSVTEDDFAQIRAELSDYGYVKKHAASGGKKKKSAAKPLHFVSEDGFDVYVGKNNYQNEAITFGLADGGDWWFHAKGAPGSHVIVKSGNEEPSDATFEAAAALAAWYSSLKDAPKAEVDYTKKKNIKKPAGGRPGFVIYHTNYSMAVAPGIHPGLKAVK